MTTMTVTAPLTRKQLYFQLLNRQFDTVLQQLRTIPTSTLDYNFLQLYLAQSCRWAHVASLDFIWYKYVMRQRVLIIRPAQLCQMSNIALNSGKLFMPEQIYYYFKSMYGKSSNNFQDSSGSGTTTSTTSTTSTLQYTLWEYELSKLKFESFVRGTSNKNRFIDKWKVFIEDMDNELPISTQFKVRDFPYLVRSLSEDIDCNESSIANLLLSGGNGNGNSSSNNNLALKVRNPSTFVLLLNVALLQPQFSRRFKLALFYKFFETRKSLNYDDTFTILFKLFKGDKYQLARLAESAGVSVSVSENKSENKTDIEDGIELPALARRYLLEGLKGTNC